MKLLLFLLMLLPGVVCGQIISKFAGTGISGSNTGDGGPATGANIDYPVGGIFDKFGNFYFTTGNVGNTIRKIGTDGLITTVAGINGVAGFSGDGNVATLAMLNNPQSVAVDTTGNIYISDETNNRIRKIDISTGIISTYAGTGIASFGGDGGPASDAKFNVTSSICIDKFGNLYVIDYSNKRVRKITSTGIITTVAGNGVSGYGGNGVPATSVSISMNGCITIDNDNNLLIADGYSRIFKVDSTGIISYFAGNGISGSSGDGGLATNASIIPTHVIVDRFGDVFFTEQGLNKVRRINSHGIINTEIGNGTTGSFGDGGAASLAELNHPTGISIDNCSNIYISTAHDWRIRKVTYSKCNYLSVPEVSAPTTFTLYPNPTTEEITLLAPEQIKTVSITDVLGKVVFNGAYSSTKVVLDVRHFASGVYFVKVNRKVVDRFVKE